MPAVASWTNAFRPDSSAPRGVVSTPSTRGGAVRQRAGSTIAIAGDDVRPAVPGRGVGAEVGMGVVAGVGAAVGVGAGVGAGVGRSSAPQSARPLAWVGGGRGRGDGRTDGGRSARGRRRGRLGFRRGAGVGVGGERRRDGAGVDGVSRGRRGRGGAGARTAPGAGTGGSRALGIRCRCTNGSAALSFVSTVFPPPPGRRSMLAPAAALARPSPRRTRSWHHPSRPHRSARRRWPQGDRATRRGETAAVGGVGDGGEHARGVRDQRWRPGWRRTAVVHVALRVTVPPVDVT